MGAERKAGERVGKSLGETAPQLIAEGRSGSACLLGYDVLLASDAHTTENSDTLPAENIIAFYNETLKGFLAGERECGCSQPARFILLRSRIEVSA
jgi:hypothetical protein